MNNVTKTVNKSPEQGLMMTKLDLKLANIIVYSDVYFEEMKTHRTKKGT